MPLRGRDVAPGTVALEKPTQLLLAAMSAMRNGHEGQRSVQREPRFENQPPSIRAHVARILNRPPYDDDDDADDDDDDAISNATLADQVPAATCGGPGAGLLPAYPLPTLPHVPPQSRRAYVPKLSQSWNIFKGRWNLKRNAWGPRRRRRRRRRRGDFKRNAWGPGRGRNVRGPGARALPSLPPLLSSRISSPLCVYRHCWFKLLSTETWWTPEHSRRPP